MVIFFLDTLTDILLHLKLIFNHNMNRKHWDKYSEEDLCMAIADNKKMGSQPLFYLLNVYALTFYGQKCFKC